MLFNRRALLRALATLGLAPVLPLAGPAPEEPLRWEEDELDWEETPAPAEEAALAPFPGFGYYPFRRPDGFCYREGMQAIADGKLDILRDPLNVWLMPPPPEYQGAPRHSWPDIQPALHREPGCLRLTNCAVCPSPEGGASFHASDLIFPTVPTGMRLGGLAIVAPRRGRPIPVFFVGLVGIGSGADACVQWETNRGIWRLDPPMEALYKRNFPGL